MEFAEESVTPKDAAAAFIPASANIRFTADCASSKFPLMPIAWTFGSDGVVIWRRCIVEVPVAG